jgi:AcrR family transcriptional regulator
MSKSQPVPVPSFGGDWSDRRADARRNHERIIVAALEVFSERGLEATMPEVAKRAGVGKATVYRSYPTKAGLIDAVAEYQLRWVEERIAWAAEQPDAHQALGVFLDDLAERLASDRILADVVPQDLSSRTQRMAEALSALLDAAKAQGRLRPDVSNEDVRVLFGGSIRQLVAMGIRDPAVWRRYSRLILRALSK